jgi:hypothetical protein
MGTMSGGSIAKRPPSPSVCEGGNSSRRASVSSGSSRTAGLVVWGCALATAQKRSVACRRKTGRSICQMRAAPISAAAAAAKTRIMFFLPPRCPLQQRVPRKAGRMLPWSLVRYRRGPTRRPLSAAAANQRAGLLPGLWMCSARRADGLMHHNQRHETPFPHLGAGLVRDGCGRQGGMGSSVAWAWAGPQMADVVGSIDIMMHLSSRPARGAPPSEESRKHSSRY